MATGELYEIFTKRFCVSCNCSNRDSTVSSVEAISSDEAVQSALARVPGATVTNVTEFNRDYENGRLEYEGEIHYNGYEYDFEIDADTGTITKWEVEQEAY